MLRAPAKALSLPGAHPLRKCLPDDCVRLIDRHLAAHGLQHIMEAYGAFMWHSDGFRFREDDPDDFFGRRGMTETLCEFLKCIEKQLGNRRGPSPYAATHWERRRALYHFWGTDSKYFQDTTSLRLAYALDLARAKGSGGPRSEARRHKLFDRQRLEKFRYKASVRQFFYFVKIRYEREWKFYGTVHPPLDQLNAFLNRLSAQGFGAGLPPRSS